LPSGRKDETLPRTAVRGEDRTVSCPSFVAVTNAEEAHVTDDAATAVATYFDFWRTKDFDRLRAVLAQDVDFLGRLHGGRIPGVDGAARASQMTS
jgi:hypothetical protein